MFGWKIRQYFILIMQHIKNLNLVDITKICNALYLSSIQHRILQCVISVNHTATNSAMRYICQPYSTKFCTVTAPNSERVISVNHTALNSALRYICQLCNTKFCNALYLPIIQQQILQRAFYLSTIQQHILQHNSTNFSNVLYLSIIQH